MEFDGSALLDSDNVRRVAAVLLVEDDGLDWRGARLHGCCGAGLDVEEDVGKFAGGDDELFCHDVARAADGAGRVHRGVDNHGSEGLSGEGDGAGDRARGAGIGGLCCGNVGDGRRGVGLAAGKG